jgi:demethylmenaquinone methyltransferase/2-methoxy-6-polyprenyl-1,4-benzoquinol methylase
MKGWLAGLGRQWKPGRWGYLLATEPLLRQAKERVLQVVLERRPRRVLEVGCGTCRQSILIARHGVAVSGVDVSDALFPPPGSRRVPAQLSLQVADGRSLPFETGSFDLALIALVLHALEPAVQRAVIGEMVRVLRPGGTLLLADFDFDIERDRTGSALLIRLFERLAGGEHHRNSQRFLRRGGITALAAAAGLKVDLRHPILNGMGSILVAESPG